ncbi:MAG: ATP phosphoribosyltransferase regulatory subunit [Gammaproteobacteria bacterium]|nr:ATP phosphoribosyltransferase regulatory subunit [Gammaproteobacteria bacterium]
MSAKPVIASQNRWLLPEGIEELLPDEVKRLESMRRTMLDLFTSWGYDQVMPPMLEYVEALQTGVGSELDLQTIKVTDQLSGRMMGIRPDITPQAARIDAHYLKYDRPSRLCYIAPVLRARPDGFGGSREPLQLGAELYGYAGSASDAESLCLMLTTLNTAGVENIHIDLGHVGIFRGLVARAGLNTEREKALFEALQRKAKPEITAMLDQWAVAEPIKACLAALADLNGDLSVLEEARALLADAPKEVSAALEQVAAVAEGVRRSYADMPIYIDLAELSGYSYYTGVVYSAFVPGHGRAIAKGGRYDGIGAAFGRARPATGFGADLRELIRLAPTVTTEAGGIFTVLDESDGEQQKMIHDLRAQGERVVVQFSDGEGEAADFACDRLLGKQGKAWKVSNI